MDRRTRTALEIIERNSQRAFESAAEVDAHVLDERAAWDDEAAPPTDGDCALVERMALESESSVWQLGVQARVALGRYIREFKRMKDKKV